MALRKVATVFGGGGFIGRYVVKRLAASGYVVRVAGRDPESARPLMVAGRVAQVVPLFASLTQEGTVERAVEAADVVVNLVGLLSERRHGDFHRVHVDGAGRVARSAAAARVRQLVHISAIGADPGSESIYARTKGEGEAQVFAAFPNATVLRPSIVFGAEDKFFNRFGRLAELLPVMPVIQGSTRFQPVYVGDVADAVMACLARDDVQGRTYELGGPDIRTFREILAWILKETHRNRPLLNIPTGVARFQATIAERLPGKPFTRDQLLLLSRDNVVTPGAAGLDALGIVPTPIELIVPAYLDRYRPGGGKRDAMPRGLSDPDLSGGEATSQAGQVSGKPR